MCSSLHLPVWPYHSPPLYSRQTRELTCPRIAPTIFWCVALSLHSCPSAGWMKPLSKLSLNTYTFQKTFLHHPLCRVVPIPEFSWYIVPLYSPYSTHNSLRYIIFIYHHLSLWVGHEFPECKNHVIFVSAFPSHCSDQWIVYSRYSIVVWRIGLQKDFSIRLLIIALFEIAKNWKQSNCPSAEFEQISHGTSIN